ncbi:hypothetical protein BDV33DRAFT_186085 [Aspergillus novoparasiticus]|uniref:Uncharacterized protein n=1 Tax=Aspergillus novoparasiticus TaxID=986946 RepID=A0A5N6E684_9EURO|nr:hypothetical protein BDV33DRAFT_186085 [Aspergillus novoparasiticus]
MPRGRHRIYATLADKNAARARRRAQQREEQRLHALSTPLHRPTHFQNSFLAWDAREERGDAPPLVHAESVFTELQEALEVTITSSDAEDDTPEWPVESHDLPDSPSEISDTESLSEQGYGNRHEILEAPHPRSLASDNLEEVPSPSVDPKSRLE